jgi:hypothetical protein
MSDFAIESFLGSQEDEAAIKVATVELLPPSLAHLESELEALSAEWERAAAEDATQNREPVAPAVGERYMELLDQVEGAKVKFTFRCLGAKGWADLLARFPPSKAQRATHPNIDYDPDVFPVEAIAACSHNPKLTIDDAKALYQRLPVTEWALLWGTVIEVNRGGGFGPKATMLGTILRRSAASAATAANEESLDQSF